MKSKRLNIVLLTIGILMLPAAARAQTTGNIRGYVLDATTGSPIVGATVDLFDGTGYSLDISSMTNMQGLFFFPGHSPGTYGLQSRFTGYTSVTVSNVQVLNGIDSWIYIQMGSPITTRYVTNTHDSDAGSFRQALTEANGGTGTQTIRFDIQIDDPGYNATSGSFTIQPSGGLPTISNPAIIDGYTQPGASQNTNGAGLGSNAVLEIELDGTNAGSIANGLVLSAGSGGSTVRGLTINRFARSGIWIQSEGDHTIEGNFIGTDVLGTTALGNGWEGISIQGQPDNTIGGITASASNVISGNSRAGILIEGSGAINNTIQGNYIGTDCTGAIDLGNGFNGITLYSSNNVVGGTSASARNVISGNEQNGIVINGTATIVVTDNVVMGNYVGTKASGIEALGNNSAGIRIGNSSNNVIGGLATGAGNVISGNQYGISISSALAPATGNQILGNLIGTDYTGNTAVANTIYGVNFSNSPDNLIGGTVEEARNIISGNGSIGIAIYGSNGSRVEGNYIGTNISGDGALGSTSYGVRVRNSTNITIGGSVAGAGNVISGNNNGVIIDGAEASGHLIIGNLIGTDHTGTEAIANSGYGITINGSPDNIIGGVTLETRNVISSNMVGVRLVGTGATGNQILGNYIGIKATGDEALGNTSYGVEINGGVSNIIGGASSGAGNVISGNLNGIYIRGTSATGNQILGNLIGTDADGLTAIPNNNRGISIYNCSNNTIGGTAPEHRNVISGNRTGILLGGTGATGNKILGNYIGINGSGDAALGNTDCGVEIVDGVSNIIGGTTAGARNIISGNEGDGIVISGENATGNIVQGNFVGTNVSGTERLGNNNGISLFDAPTTTVGGTSIEARNVISGNNRIGIEILGVSTAGSIIQGNYIGITASGDDPLGNAAVGLVLNNAPNITIGGTETNAGNVISANYTHGISIMGDQASDNVVLGNKIGTNAAGDVSLGNIGQGISISRSPGTIIGGEASGAGNLISGNYEHGIVVLNETATGTIIQGNYIGTSISGLERLGNSNGIYIHDAPNTTVGGASIEARNVISGNNRIGIEIIGASSAGSIIQGNYIGINATGDDALGNISDGIVLNNAPNITIGGTEAGAGNVISGNNSRGIAIMEEGASDNIIQGNKIGTNAAGDAAFGNFNPGISVYMGDNTLIGGDIAGAGNLISGNYSHGILVEDQTTSGTIIQGNYIGTNLSGAATIPNTIHGVFIDRSPNNVVGGNQDGAGNLISGNMCGVMITGGTATGNSIQGNYIGTNADGLLALPNTHSGVNVLDASNNTIGGTTAGAGNLISGNASGIYLQMATSTGNEIQGNLIGTDLTGNTALPNTLYAILIDQAVNNTVGGVTPAARNTISSSSTGIWITRATGNQIQGNYIGTNSSGTSALGNTAEGVGLADAPANTIGGTEAGSGNVISGNGTGILITGSASTGNQILGNLVGTDHSGALAIANTVGIDIREGASINVVELNTIAHHAGNGVQVFGTGVAGNTIWNNSIYSNGGLGIDLGWNGVTENDYDPPVDDDNGGSNNFQNYPELTSAELGADTLDLQGFLRSTPNTSFTIHVYYSTTADPSGYGEGETPLGLFQIATDGEGYADFSAGFGTIPVGTFITATATDATGNTSEFSLSIPIVTGAPSSSPPRIDVYQPTGTQSRDVTIHYVIWDEQDDPVDLKVEYSPDGGISWTPATVDGFTTGLDLNQYYGQLVWRSATDLPDQDLFNIPFKITPSDAEEGIADITVIDVDNEAPRWMVVEGAAGSPELRFWFDETVSEIEVLDAVNYTLAASLTIDTISPVDDWSAVNSLNFARIDAASGVMNDLLYVAGGSSGGTQQVGRLESYNPAIGNWTTLEPMPTPRRGPVGGTIDGKFYVAGGYDTDYHDTLEVYDPVVTVTPSWSGRASMPTARMWAASAVISMSLVVKQMAA